MAHVAAEDTVLELARNSADLAELRIRMGWTLAKLSEETGLSITTLSRVERFHYPPSERTKIILQDRLGLPLSEVTRLLEAPEPASADEQGTLLNM